MTDYVLATDPDEVDRRRMALLFAYHGPLRRGDFTELEFGGKGFDLITAQMLLMHLPNPAAGCRRFVELAAPGGQIVVHDADFSPVALSNASPLEAEGLAVMSEVMRIAGVDTALGPNVADLLEPAGATIEQAETRRCETTEDARVAAETTAITIERFRQRADVPGAAIDAALAGLRDPSRQLTGPTRWVVRARTAK